MKKTRIFAVLAAMAMGLAVFGCSNGDSDSSGGGSTGGSTSGGTTGGSTSYSIAISSDSNGTVEADKTSAQKGETITLSVSAREGYELNSITVMDASSKTITLTTVTSDKKYNFTMPSSNVTVTAVFNVKYVNPHSVGDIVLKDGTFIPYSKDLTLTDEQKANAIAVIFYAGNRSDTLGARTLGVGLKTSKDDEYDKITTIEDRSIKNYYRGTLLQWAPKGTAGYNINFTQTASGDFGEGDLDGSDNWDIICKRDSNAQSTAATNYPAFNWVNTYASRYGITGMYADGWYMPTTSELITVFSSEVANKIMGVFEKIDGSLSLFKEERGTYKDEEECVSCLEQGKYWTSCQWSDSKYVHEEISTMGYQYYDDGYRRDYCVSRYDKDEYAYVLAIHSF